MSEENKQLMRRWYEEVLGAGNLDAADRFLAADYVEHDPFPPGLPSGLEGFKAFFRSYLDAFPDARVEVEGQLAEGDMVVSRLTVRGTHKGDLMDIPASGNAVSIRSMDWVRIANGKIVEHWGVDDQLGLMQQIGAIPVQG
ncbi:MAG: ester cyclase [Dehalococcoidia bacterium]